MLLTLIQILFLIILVMMKFKYMVFAIFFSIVTLFLRKKFIFPSDRNPVSILIFFSLAFIFNVISFFFLQFGLLYLFFVQFNIDLRLVIIAVKIKCMYYYSEIF